MQENNLFPATESSSCSSQLQLNLPRRILVVDQDPYLCHLSADVLIRHGYEVNAVEDGAAGWEELQANPYDLLITEHDLPKISGVKLVKKVRAAHLDLPVVMVAVKFPTRLARNSSLQLATMLLKPLPIDKLLETVNIVLRASSRPTGQTAPPAPQLQPSAQEREQRLLAARAKTIEKAIQEMHRQYGDYCDSVLND